MAENLMFIDDQTIVCNIDSRLISLDLDTMEPNWQYQFASYFMLTPDKKRIVTGDRNEVVLLDARTGDICFKHAIKDYLEGEGLIFITGMDMDPAGRYLCLGTNSGQALLFDMENQSLIGDYRIHYKEVTDVAISDGIVAVSSSDFSTENFSLISKGKGALDVFTFSGQRIISRLFDYSGISLMEFSPYNPNLLVFRESEKINVLDISEDMLLHTFISGGFVTDYVIMDGYLLSSSADGTIRLWVMDGIGWEYAFSRITLPQSINNIAVHAGVMAVSYNSSNKAIILRDLKNEDALVLSDHYGSIGGCSFNPDGSRLLTYTADSGQIAVWDWKPKNWPA